MEDSTAADGDAAIAGEDGAPAGPELDRALARAIRALIAESTEMAHHPGN